MVDHDAFVEALVRLSKVMGAREVELRSVLVRAAADAVLRSGIESCNEETISFFSKLHGECRATEEVPS